MARSSCSRFCARSWRRRGLRHTSNRSPGNSALTISATWSGCSSDVGAKFSIDFTVFLIFEQLADVGVAKRRDPIQCDRQQILADACRGNHAAVADQRYVVNVEALANLADLRGHSAGVSAVAGEHFNRDRTAIGGTQQAIDDLHLAAFAVSVVAECGKRTALSFDIAGGDIVEN